MKIKQALITFFNLLKASLLLLRKIFPLPKKDIIIKDISAF